MSKYIQIEDFKVEESNPAKEDLPMFATRDKQVYLLTTLHEAIDITTGQRAAYHTFNDMMGNYTPRYATITLSE